jgi:anti-anti-sigma factor
VNPAAAVTDLAVRTLTGRRTVLALRGELDLATVSVFEAAFEAIDFASVGHVLLDLDELAFMDVCGLRAVLGLHALCREQSTALTIRPGPRAVQRVFELTGTDCLLRFERRAA